jgi:hypothetical protein
MKIVFLILLLGLPAFADATMPPCAVHQGPRKGWIGPFTVYTWGFCREWGEELVCQSMSMKYGDHARIPHQVWFDAKCAKENGITQE